MNYRECEGYVSVREGVTGKGMVSKAECYTLSSKLWSADRRLL